RTEAADPKFFAFQLLQAGDAGPHEHQLVEFVLHADDEHQIISREISLNHRADVYDRWFAGGERLRRHLAAAQKNRIEFQAVFSKQPLFLRYPDMALGESERRITHRDPLELLRLQ